MNNDLVPPRSSSRPSVPSSSLSRSTSHSRVSDDIAAPQLIRRGNSDSASLTLERHLKQKQPLRKGETWKDFLQDINAASVPDPSMEVTTQAGPVRTLRGTDGLSDLFVTPGVTSSSASNVQAQRTDRSPERREKSLLKFQQRFGSVRVGQARGRADGDGSGVRRNGQSTLRRAATTSTIDERQSGRKRHPSTVAEVNTGTKKRASNVTSGQAASSNASGVPNTTTDPRAYPPASSQLNSPQHPVDPSRRQSSTNVILPHWQPDNEVDSCTICGTNFSLWYRRHHCRKCGRVVCANCSPHRITIPKQFIVQPPSILTSSAVTATSTNAENAVSNFAARFVQEVGEYSTAALNGAEVVRVCNPCVPDPNFSPPPQAAPFGAVPLPPLLPSIGRPQNQIPQRSGSLAVNTMPPSRQSDARFSAYQFLQQGHSRTPAGQTRSGSLTTTPTTSSSFRASANPFAIIQQHSIAGVPIFGRQQAPSASAAQPLPQPTQPRRIIKEEDECPVCGRELPMKGPEGDESERERHVMDCINAHSGSTTTTAGANVLAPATTANVASAEITDESQAVAGASVQHATTTVAAAAGPSSAPNASAPIATQSRRTSSLAPPAAVSSSSGSSLPRHAHPSRASPSNQGISTSTPAPLSSLPSTLTERPHAPRMLVYRATEKDCTTSEGEPQECVICFEEFEEGDEMARLECLCKFHRGCIREWFGKKAREGEGCGCPTHVLGVWG